jgi:hypothetical protein
VTNRLQLHGDLVNCDERIAPRDEPQLLGYSARLTPEPPISFGTSCNFGNPSRMRSRVSW